MWFEGAERSFAVRRNSPQNNSKFSVTRHGVPRFPLFQRESPLRECAFSRTSDKFAPRGGKSLQSDSGFQRKSQPLSTGFVGLFCSLGELECRADRTIAEGQIHQRCDKHSSKGEKLHRYSRWPALHRELRTALASISPCRRKRALMPEKTMPRSPHAALNPGRGHLESMGLSSRA